MCCSVQQRILVCGSVLQCVVPTSYVDLHVSFRPTTMTTNASPALVLRQTIATSIAAHTSAFSAVQKEYKNMHTYTHIYIHKYMCMYIHIYVYIYKYIHEFYMYIYI